MQPRGALWHTKCMLWLSHVFIASKRQMGSFLPASAARDCIWDSHGRHLVADAVMSALWVRSDGCRQRMVSHLERLVAGSYCNELWAFDTARPGEGWQGVDGVTGSPPPPRGWTQVNSTGSCSCHVR